MTEHCQEHSGLVKDIEHLKSENDTQWEEIDKMRKRADYILTRINIVLGGVVVSLILMVINMATK